MTGRALITRSRRLLRRTWPLVAMLVLVGVLIPLRLASPLRMLYPVLGVAIAAYLQRHDTARYVSFVIWMWFLSPFVRRLADLFAGWQDPSLVLLTPYLVTAVCIPSLVHSVLNRHRYPRSKAGGVGMFAVAALGVSVGIPFGLASGPSAAALEIMNWMLPPMFGWYIATRFDEVHRIEAAITTSFLVAGAIAGLYGLYQFSRPPAWDINWMQMSGMTTIGRPEPFAVRVFGTMHSPGIFSAFLVISLVTWLARPKLTGLLSASVAGVALLLSQVRSSWLALGVAALFVFGSLPTAQRLRMAGLAVIAVVVSGPFLITPQMSALVGDRVATMERLEDDESAVARVLGHALALEFVTENPLGAGIGQVDPKIEQFISMRDSVIAAALVQFGLAGTLLYVIALCGLLAWLWTYYWNAASFQGAALASAALGLLAVGWLSVVSAGPIGVWVWATGGLAIGDREMRRRRAAPLWRNPYDMASGGARP